MTLHGIDLDSPAIRAFCRKWKIRELAVFGSIVRDDFRSDSDVDFLATFDEKAELDMFGHFDKQEDLEAIIGRPVDVVDRSVIENSHNRFRKREILSTAECVLAAG